MVKIGGGDEGFWWKMVALGSFWPKKNEREGKGAAEIFRVESEGVEWRRKVKNMRIWGSLAIAPRFP